ncbi:MAG: hypothetical protein ACP5G4_11170, partial [bacterium]
MNYQGKLTDPAGVAITGDHAIVFRIYDSETGGTMLWSEAHPAVTLSNGLFDVILGEVSAMSLPFDNEYWIEIEIDGETLAPREKLASVAYAHRAVYADTAEYVSGGGGGIGGSGTNGRIARFTPDGTTLGNSTFRDDGTTVGLNAAQTSANMLYIQDDRAISAKQGLYVDSYTSNTGTGDIVGLLSKARVTTSGNHNAAGIIGMVDGNDMNWAVGVMAVNKSGSSTPVVPSVLTALYADGSNNWAWSGWFTGGHVAISRATSTQTGELHFQDLDGTALANYVGFKAPTALSSNYVYTLPASFPASSGQVLSSTTAGVLSWTSAGGSGDYIQNQSATN